VWDLKSPEALRALASRLAPFVSATDFIALYGGLGAGKTLFAQGMLAALGVEEAVTSPTYPIVHSHSAGIRVVYHCDFYRLGAFEEEEAGFSEMCAEGIVVAEWAGAIRSALPENRLEVHIEGEGDIRQVGLTGFGAWQQKLTRFQEISSFLDQHGWGDAPCAAIRGDASARLFWRLKKDHETIMVMDWPHRSDGPAVKNGRTYNEIAHRAREGRAFIAISRWLREKVSLSAPTVVAFDAARGLYLLEDLGDGLFGQVIAAGQPLETVYSLAVDGLLAMRASNAPQDLAITGEQSFHVPEFDRDALEIELELIVEWYFKWASGQACSSTAAASFSAAWSPLLDWIEDQPKGLLLRDYHSANLFLCEGRPGLARLGVIDFQDALWGHPAYDLVSLLQDARLDVPEESELALYERYCAGAAKLDPSFDKQAFGKAYAILGAQRNTKILGIFARLSMGDGKHAYLAHLPRISRYLRRNLKHPDLESLEAWYEANVFNPAGERPPEALTA
jgi:tRNA threonylcarbamoyl adenosine modification protein YjeE